jgi:O-antigen ligase
LVAFFGLLVYCLRDGIDHRSWYWLGIVCGIVGAGGGLVFYFQRESLHIDHNAIGYLFLTPLFVGCVAYPLVAGRPASQLALAALMAVNLSWVFLANSRGDLLVAFICTCILCSQLRSTAQRIVLLGLVILVSIAIISQFEDDRARTLTRMERLFDADQSLRHRTSGRYNLAMGALNMFLEHPMGLGTGSFSFHWATLADAEGPSGFRRNVKMDAHSAWLKVAVENGIPGVLLLAVFVLWFAAAGWKKRHQGMFSVGLLATGVLCAAYVTTEFQAKGLWFMGAGATALLTRE